VAGSSEMGSHEELYTSVSFSFARHDIELRLNYIVSYTE